MILMLMGLAQGAVVDDHKHSVKLHTAKNIGLVSVRWSTKKGKVKTGGRHAPRVAFSTSKGLAVCGKWQPAPYMAGMYKRWANWLEEKVDIEASPNSDFGGKEPIGSNMVGYCRLYATSRDGVLQLSLISNRACFGKAGCNTDRTVASIKKEELPQVIAAFRMASELMRGNPPAPEVVEK